MIVPARRGFLLGAAAFLAAPSIVRAANLMPVKAEPTRVWLPPNVTNFTIRNEGECRTIIVFGDEKITLMPGQKVTRARYVLPQPWDSYVGGVYNETFCGTVRAVSEPRP